MLVVCLSYQSCCARLLMWWGFGSSPGGCLQTGEDARLNDFFAKDDEPLLTGPTK